ncbi:serine proteinase stubble-like [Homarus americanus]|uniref:serine proteinase stubble-like n=1 Tax=Homarus americanus TaxID=6706 RepID=UPI001C4760F5|nr:serine proteinase stubble-like [Homarus americanus]
MKLLLLLLLDLTLLHKDVRCLEDQSATLDDLGCSATGVERVLAAGDTVKITTPRYPWAYPGFSQCAWNIKRGADTLMLKVQCDDFMLEFPSRRQTCRDFLRLNSDVYCTKQTISLTFHADLAALFKSNSRRGRRGFSCTVTATSKQPRMASSLTAQPSEDVATTQMVKPECSGANSQEVILNPGDTAHITSPRYPEAYPNNLHCNWLIQGSDPSVALSLFCEAFHLQSKGLWGRGCFDYLRVGTGVQYCGNRRPPTQVRSGSLALAFKTDEAVNRPGFSCYVKAEGGDTTAATTTTVAPTTTPAAPATTTPAASTTAVTTTRTLAAISTNVALTITTPDTTTTLTASTTTPAAPATTTPAASTTAVTTTRTLAAISTNVALTITTPDTTITLTAPTTTAAATTTTVTSPCIAITIISQFTIGSPPYTTVATVSTITNTHPPATTTITSTLTTSVPSYFLSFPSALTINNPTTTISSVVSMVTTAEVTTPATTDPPPPPLQCGVSNRPMLKIVGGKETGEHEFPWQVGLIHKGDKTQVFCGGSVIHPKWVITAAHCLDFIVEDEEEYLLLVGAHNLLEGETMQERQIKNFIIHEDYDKEMTAHDIALVEVEELVLTEEVSPVCLPDPDDLYSGVQATVTGWGTLSDGGQASPKLMAVTLHTLTNAECEVSYGTRVTENMLCAGMTRGGKDSCQGDSGGPLVTLNSGTGRYQIIGIVSWGRGCGVAGSPGVYTRTSSYIDWILWHFENDTTTGLM